MEKQVNDGTFDECAYVHYVKVKDDDDLRSTCLRIFDAYCTSTNSEQYCILILKILCNF